MGRIAKYPGFDEPVCSVTETLPNGTMTKLLRAQQRLEVGPELVLVDALLAEEPQPDVVGVTGLEGELMTGQGLRDLDQVVERGPLDLVELEDELVAFDRDLLRGRGRGEDGECEQ